MFDPRLVRLCALGGALVACYAIPKIEHPTVNHPWKSTSDASSPFKTGVYTGPFLQITQNGLNVANPADGFGPEDKMVACNGNLVFIDLDYNGGTWFSFDTATWTPSQGQIQMKSTCNSFPLVPRSSGYTIGLTAESGSSGNDKILLVGGDANETNVYFSDDCGVSWSCTDDPELWTPRDYTTIIPTTGILPGNPVVIAGGRSFVGRVFNKDIFLSFDGGLTWDRPQCTDPKNCGKECMWGGCRLEQPDPIGSCSASNSQYTNCYYLPDFPVYPGSFATDWSTLWLFMAAEDDGYVWTLNATTYNSAWHRTEGTWGGFGRKVFIKGTLPGSGCWFSTDYEAVELWVRPSQTANSMAGFATSVTGDGPWTDWTGKFITPWDSTPRASAAVTSSPYSTGAWFASGMNFSAGVASLPTYGDAYQIDAGVCLISPVNNKVCSGLVDPNLNSVACPCLRAFMGDPYCGSCTPSIAYGVWPACAMCPSHSGSLGGPPCGAAAGRGYCDPLLGCVCENGFTQPETGCDGCAPGFWGALCTACPVCQHGSCDGSGSTGGSGVCKCDAGWSGNDCSQAVAPRGVDGGAAAAGVMGGLIGASIIGVIVYVKFFKGGAAVAKALRSAASLADGSSGAETASFLDKGAAVPSTAKAPPSRFATSSDL